MDNVLKIVARRRVPLGFAIGIAAVVMAQPTWRSFGAGAGLSLIGEGIRVWAAGHLEKGREVTRSGPYRWVRHPLYFGSVLMGVGFAVAANRPSAGVLVLLYLLITVAAAIRVEEHWLSDRFGAEYDHYRRGDLPATRREFSLRRVAANREYRAVAGLAAVMALLAWKASGTS